MKAKNVRLVCCNKFDSFVQSITDGTVQKLVRENSIITGGSIASMLLGEEVNDFDLYFRNRETVVAVANYYVSQFKKNPPTRFKHGNGEVAIRVAVEEDRVKIVVKSAGVASEDGSDGYQYFEGTDPESGEAAEYLDKVMEVAKDFDSNTENGKTRYRPVFLSSNAISLSDKVQLVIRFYGEPDKIHENYDFVHCTSYWTSWDRKLTLRPEAVESLLAKELRYVGSKYPICSMIRTRKFIQRGWAITAGQYLKIAMQISELDMNDFGVLEEQLTGVDTAYFMEILDKLKSRDPAKVDSAYLVELIDRLF